MSDLNLFYNIDERSDAIRNHQDGILVCLAGPGTGKTYSFLQRIRVLTNEHGVPGDQICYLTFIREISKAFMSDYEAQEGEVIKSGNKPRISTLHSYACRVIRNQGFRYGFDGPLYFVSIADRQDDRSKLFLTDLLPFVNRDGLRTVPQLREAVQDAKQAWRDGVEEEGLSSQIKAIKPPILDLSRAYRLVDWDYTVPFAQELLQGLSEPPEWVQRIKHFLIDEYQDFNLAEQSLLMALTSRANSVVIVGDDDQSLYSGRGGSPEGLRKLYNSGEVDRVSLVRCYRCKSRILQAANKFLAVMRPDPQPMQAKDDGGDVACYKFKSRKAEVGYLTGFLKGHIAALPEMPAPKDGIACLFPTWDVLNSYMSVMSPEVSCYSRSWPPHPTREWLERALALVCNPGKRFVERLLLECFGAIKPDHKREMVKLILQEDISPADAVERLALSNRFSSTAKTEAQAFSSLCRALSSQDPGQIADELGKRVSVKRSELAEHIEAFLERVGEPEEEDAIRTLCDTVIPESALPPENPRAVLFSTMHGSKGLTKRTIVMPGLEDAWLPGNAQGSDLEEKRRLFYVALTRATDNVRITYPQTRPPRDPLNYDVPGRRQASRFVKESDIPETYYS